MDIAGKDLILGGVTTLLEYNQICDIFIDQWPQAMVGGGGTPETVRNRVCANFTGKTIECVIYRDRALMDDMEENGVTDSNRSGFALLYFNQSQIAIVIDENNVGLEKGIVSALKAIEAARGEDGNESG